MNVTFFKKKLCYLALIPLLSSASIYAAEKTTTKISTGFFYSSGQSDVADLKDTTTTLVPVMISVKKNRLSFGASSSYLSIDAATLKEEGMGDTTVYIAYDLTEDPWVSVKLKHKFPTGDEAKSLSTGKDDTSISLDYFYPIQGNTSVFANIEHKFVGKIPGVEMQDTTSASIGTGYSLSSGANIGASLDYRQSSFLNLDDQIGASVFVSKSLNKTVSLSAFGGYDSTETSSLGMTITTKF
ncbi:MAG: hypothetical protein L3J38_04805 [Thiomicrorhabdus sp.]|nr:hypothetical protein [Thiomicrorhabdus sp.]